jgi:ABC-type glycerol-3-phosphate transport system permease component
MATWNDFAWPLIALKQNYLCSHCRFVQGVARSGVR